MIWSPIQDSALKAVDAWLTDAAGPQVFRLFGYAGTGKTTLAKHLAANVDGLVLFAAYTGKAASVLKRSGCPNASTIHSILYDVRPPSMLRIYELEQELVQSEPDSYSRKEIEAELKAEKARAKRPNFSKNSGSILRDADLLVLDECSMVDATIAQDLMSFGKKILVLGDPAQLPPVRGNGYFINAKPDILLSEIHRQALDSPIIRWSKLIREGGSLPMGAEGACRRVPRGMVDTAYLAAAGQVLTGKNDTRRDINSRIRKHLGITSAYPVKGERLVILRNEKEYGVLNGVTCTAMRDAVLDDSDDSYVSVTIDYEGSVIQQLPLCRSQFDAYSNPARADDINFNKRWLVPADYGYALTVHKSQGSQWDNVLVYDDGFAKREPLNRKRWLYTAITRAQNSLTVAF